MPLSRRLAKVYGLTDPKVRVELEGELVGVLCQRTGNGIACGTAKGTLEKA